jgi:hypothetical protein
MCVRVSSCIVRKPGRGPLANEPLHETAPSGVYGDIVDVRVCVRVRSCIVQPARPRAT